MTRRGLLFVFEGPDGVGKSTLSRLFADRLKAEGTACERMAFPGGEADTLGKHIYDLHHAPQRFGIGSVDAAAIQTLHIAAHIDAIEKRIRPALREGKCVVLDRYWWSTWAYGMVSGVSRRSLNAMVKLEKVHWGRVRPSVVFLVRRSEPVGECDEKELWERLSRAYQELAEEEGDRYPVHRVDNEGTVEKTLEMILCVARKCLSERSSSRVRAAGRRDGVDSNSQQLALGFSKERLVAAKDLPTPEVFSRLAPAVPTEVFETYWRFAAERQAIFFKRFRDLPPPWTDDPILRRFKFTNAYRASDRVSQFLIRHVIYEGDQRPEEVVFRTMLFKTFNRIGTWQLLVEALGQVTYKEYTFARYDQVLSRATATGQRIYSAAYIMPTGRSRFGSPRKHRNHLRVLELMMNEDVPARIAEARSMREAFELLRSYPTLGDFLAYQYVTDINYSEIMDFSETEFVVAGPGAKDGIRKCFRSLGGLNDRDIIRLMTERQQEEFGQRGIEFKSLWGRRLQLIDCQNLFCEVAKYARVAHPEVPGLTERRRIKQRFRPNPEPIEYWYPPKWGLNDRVSEDRREVASRQGGAKWR